jgi:phospholipase/lecithinase/hemolysin
MKQVFSRLEPVKTYFADSSHLTPAGHKVMALTLADLIGRKMAGRGTGQ